jgi:predicted dienelactone hydrolase
MRMLIATLVGNLIAASLASAVDQCLTGGSALSDQRALTSLRAATETRCPCASFTGGPGATTAAYQRCARTAVNDAVAAGDLRRECKKAATAINKGAVCGSTKVACGRFTPAARTPLSCRVKNTASCKSGTRFDEQACTTQTHCADVLDWTASTCVDVRAPGPFGVGVTVRRLTKKSVVTPSANRILDTVIWYPTAAGAGPVDAVYGGVLDAALDTAAGPYPLLMFSHGSCGLPTQATFLMPLLASQGFIIVAPPHPGNTLTDFATCGGTQALVDSARERPEDIRFVLDAMLAANLDSTSPFFAAIDASKLGMSGHSFGGFTTYRVTELDARFNAALSFAAYVAPGQQLTIPSLTMLGQLDSVVDNDAIRTAYASSIAPKYLVEIADTGHFAWSDRCFPTPDCAPPATLTQDEAHDAVRRWVLPFLKVYLAGDASFAPFLAPITSPGFVFDAAP